MLLATFLSLGAAGLHAAWNFVAKRADGDRYLVLWAQFFVAGLIALPLMILSHAVWGMPIAAYGWAMASGLIHVPYCWLLARAYTVGDFSVSYPVARGGGAALAAIGGVLFLGDHLNAGEVAGISIAVAGLLVLAYGAHGMGLELALGVALTIGAYSVVDAHGSRLTGSVAYVFATFIGTALTNTVFGLALGRRAGMAAMLRSNWRRALTTGVAAIITYGLVVVAFRYAPVGYVTALRESSVVIAALAGWRLLGEGDHRRRIAAAIVVFAGLLTLVLSR